MSLMRHTAVKVQMSHILAREKYFSSSTVFPLKVHFALKNEFIATTSLTNVLPAQLPLSLREEKRKNPGKAGVMGQIREEKLPFLHSRVWQCQLQGSHVW